MSNPVKEQLTLPALEVEMEDIQSRIRGMTRLVTNLKKKGRNNYTISLLKQKLEYVTDVWRDIQERVKQLKKEVPDSKRKVIPFFGESTMDDAEDAFHEAQNFLMTELDSLIQEKESAGFGNPGNTAGAGATGQPSTLELPKQNLPRFSGDPRKWCHFADLFTASIIKDQRLSDAQRLQYLNGCLEGEALASIATLEIADRNFKPAWDTLTEQFGNPRRMVLQLLATFTKLKPIRTGDIESLQQVTVGWKQTLAALQKLGRKVEHYSDVLVILIKSKLDQSLEWEWEGTQKLNQEIPSFNEMLHFLREQEHRLHVLINPVQKQAVDPTSKPRIRQHNAVVESSPGPTLECTFCGLTHGITTCKKFKLLTPELRFHYIKANQSCINCLASTHTVARCPKNAACTKCSKKHHTILHFDAPQVGTGNRRSTKKPQQGQREAGRSNVSAREPANVNTKSRASTSSADVTSHCSATESGTPAVFLATANVRVTGKGGTTRIARALIDQGSEASFISANLANDLRLARRKTPATVTGLGGGKAQDIKYSVDIEFGSTRCTEEAFRTSAYVVSRITSYAPPSVHVPEYTALRELTLADPDPASDRPIEVLIGAGTYASIIRPGLRRFGKRGPIAQETALGWILSGPVDAATSSPNPVRTLHCTVLESLDKAIRRFWEIEEIPSKLVNTKAEDECEEYFAKTVARDATGRFIVRLPFNHENPDELLGESLPIALSALTRLRKKLDLDPTLMREYSEFLTEYESLSHMTRLEFLDKTRLYIPHRAVVRTESATTKLRVVFNASSKTAGGRSLNDILHVGPKLQNDITAVLTRWRLYQYVLVADIEKMFRQILVAAEDRRFQCIVWRTPETERTIAFELKTVTYGTACAPYLSMRTLLELKKQDGDRFPLAAPILEKDVYVDDVFMGAPDKLLLEQIRKQTCELLQQGGFNLRKWAGNSPDLLGNIPHSSHSHAVDLDLFDNSELKVLGLRWIPSGDFFYFNLQRFQPSATPITKRTLFSEIAKLYDPLGWLSPVVIRAKTLMQSQWLEKIQWDEQVSAETLKMWNTFCADWSRLNQWKLPRWIRYGADTTSVELHGFCDASLAAYSAVTYLRVTTIDNGVFTSLLMAKTRVAPIKTQSIPVLELNGAVLLAELILHVRDSLAMKIDRVVCWTDSTIALAWLKKHPSTWKVIVANRVSKIQTALPNAEWRYVPTRSNPADLNSRGIDAAEFLQSNLWTFGPTWLSEAEAQWPAIPASVETDESKRVAHAHVATPKPEWDFLFRFQSWRKLLRVTAYCLRWRRPSRVNQRSNAGQVIEAAEMRNAAERLARHIQGSHFAEEYRCLKNHRSIPVKSPLKSLNPFLDDKDVLRVGGRLENATLAWETKHPIILPKHYVSTLIIRQCHVDTLHGGLQLTLHTVRQNYWILGCRNAAKTVVNKCMRCVRWRGNTSTQIMQHLTPERCRPSRAFDNCGVDYAGPYRVRDSAGRGKTAHKAYIAVFVCYATRAVHIELVHDYTTSAFLAALDRFVARRGIPSCIFSDNGTNFVGADRELQQHCRAVFSATDTHNKCGAIGIQWRFNPPSAPHFGGMQEAGVKSVKHHLKRTLGEFTPTGEEMQTLLCKIEASLNSRPIAPLSDDPDDYASLTPGHFLTGGPLNAIPLQSWEMGRIEEVFPGKDGNVRVVKVRTAKSTYTRPITRMCRLPVDEPATTTGAEGDTKVRPIVLEENRTIGTPSSLTPNPLGRGDEVFPSLSLQGKKRPREIAGATEIGCERRAGRVSRNQAMESDTQNTQNQISATFDRCLKIGEQALQQETRTPSPLEKSHQEAVQETTQEEWTITIGPPRMGPVQLRVPEHIPRTTRRYRCTVPGGRYALRWDREQRLTSLLWRPAVDPPTPRGQEKSTAPAAAASQAGGRTPNRPRPKAREDNRQQAQAPTTSRALVAARPSPIASRTRRPPRPQGPTLEELTRAAVGIAVETSMRLLQQQQQLHPQQSASPPAHKRQRR
ncbi:uncharacterized protein LOC143186596 [Calliopsis andreniformis]|uniref:uncharacterized protein LOC143186596 n=2 Tax=Calliopsis andreniformis TaxID=337506 RepID=UPI003FCC3411